MTFERRAAECHPQKAEAARGLCWACYAAERRCWACYAAERRGGGGSRRYERYQPPSVGDATPLDPDAPRCDICAIDNVKLLQFSLIKTVRQDGRTTTRGSGGITLCEACWRGLQKRRIRVRRKRAA